MLARYCTKRAEAEYITIPLGQKCSVGWEADPAMSSWVLVPQVIHRGNA